MELGAAVEMAERKLGRQATLEPMPSLLDHHSNDPQMALELQT